MNRCDLLKQDLHLLTAEGDNESNFKHFINNSLTSESPPSCSTSCRWPEFLPAWPVLSEDAPVGSETPGFQRRNPAGSDEPVKTAATNSSTICQQITALLGIFT